MLYVRLTIKVKVGIPESFKVGWYRHKITGSSHLLHPGTLRCCYNIININKKLNLFALRQKIEVGLCQKKKRIFFSF